MAADCQSFVESLIRGFEKYSSDLDDIFNFLDTSFEALNVNMFGELLFEVFITGSIKGKCSNSFESFEKSFFTEDFISRE